MLSAPLIRTTLLAQYRHVLFTFNPDSPPILSNLILDIPNAFTYISPLYVHYPYATCARQLC